MTLPIAPGSGYPDVTQLANGDLLPTIWSETCTVKHYARVIAAEICSNTWEADIKSMGQEVIIPRTPSVNVIDGPKGLDLDAAGLYTTPTTNAATLSIDQRELAGFAIDDADAYQAVSNNLERMSEDAVKQVAIRQDTKILAGIPSEVASTNIGPTAGINADTNLGETGAPIIITLGATGSGMTNALAFLVRMKRVLEELNVDVDGGGLKVVLGPKYAEILQQGPLAAVNITGDAEGTIRTGYIGPYAGMSLFKSTLTPKFLDNSNHTEYCYVVHSDGLTWAMQYQLPEFFRESKYTGTRMRTQCLWGWNVVEPTYLCAGYVTYDSGSL